MPIVTVKQARGTTKDVHQYSNVPFVTRLICLPPVWMQKKKSICNAFSQNLFSVCSLLWKQQTAFSLWCLWGLWRSR